MAQTYLAPGWPWFISDQRLFFGIQEVRKADLPTFRVLNEWWGKDANRVYCAGSEIRNADVESFCVLNSLYAKDDRCAYTITGQIREIEDASVFEAVGPTEHAFNATNGYAKDARLVYHTTVGGKACEVKGADARTFGSQCPGFGSDQSSVFFERKKLAGADPLKWQHIRGPHSRSENKAYVLEKRIRGANGDCLESLPVLETADLWCRDNKAYYRWDQPTNPEVYFKEFRQCFIFRGKVSNVTLTWNRKELLDPTIADSWKIAQHAWIFVDCKEWIQKPDLEIGEFPSPGEPFKIGEGLRLAMLASRDWMNEDRIWILKPGQELLQPKKKPLLSILKIWWEYSTLDVLESIQKTIAATTST